MKSRIQPGTKAMQIQSEKENSRRTRTNKGKKRYFLKGEKLYLL